MPRAPSSKLPQPIFDEPAFAEGVPTPDPTRFRVPHPSDAAQYQQIQALLTKDVVGFPASRGSPNDLYSLQDALGPHGPEIIQEILKANQIVFHAVGDTGASSVAKYGDELAVSDQVTLDCHSTDPANRPAFLFQLGDVVYSFGESKFYYDQFYEPYRNYPGPIFAVAGNHDSFVIPGTPPAQAPLTTFLRNFCASEPTVTPEAGSLHRTAMTQPGLYFTLDAPFVRIIGLFSNALEDPGVISSENGKWSAVPDLQLEFLAAQLARVKSDQFAGAVILATHHPPFSYAPPPQGGSGGPHSGNSMMLGEIDAVCKAQGVYPHAFLSGHAHNYQRYTRTVRLSGTAYDVPFIVCGGGGHNVSPLVQAKLGQAAQEPATGIRVDYLDPTPAVTTGGLLLENYDDRDYGYLRVTVDSKQLRIGFYQVGTGSLPQSLADMVTVQLSNHTMISN
jgi:hypothetical protein